MAKGKGKKSPRSLNPQQKAFVREYLKDNNATQAAIRAGYSKNTAHSCGPRLLEHVGVKAAIAKGRQKAQERADLTVDDIVRSYREIAECDVTSVVGWNAQGELVVTDFESVPVEVRRCISEIRQTETKDGKRSIAIKFHSKTEALAKLGQYLGMFVQKVEVDGSDRLSNALAKLHAAVHSTPDEE